MQKEIIEILACPYDQGDLSFVEKDFCVCLKCGRKYPWIQEKIINFLPDNLRNDGFVSEKEDTQPAGVEIDKWSPGLRHWTPGFFVRLMRFGSGSGRLQDKQKEKSLLDVGCGANAQGDVNVDIYIPDPIPQNFILSTAEKLPFKDSSFDVIRSAYVIEHNPYPAEMIKEHFRVAREEVKIYTDNSDWFGAVILRLLNTGYIFHDEHYYKWSKEYMSNLIARMGFSGEVSLFNSSPSVVVKIFAIFGKLPRIGPIFYRDLGVKILKKSEKNNKNV